MDMLNRMGVSADTLGNHNFDRGSAYLRSDLIPVAQFPYLAANVRYPNGTLPPEWKASRSSTSTASRSGSSGTRCPSSRR